MKRKPVIAIGLDAAEPALIEQWMQEGHLKNLARIRKDGGYSRLQNIEYYRAETPWTTFLTGLSPEATGYWGPVKYRADRYDTQSIDAYRFQDYPPFYALGEEYKVAVFDMPQTVMSGKVNGLQVLAWGAHSPQAPSQSSPTDLLGELRAKYGSHPAFSRDYAQIYTKRELRGIHRKLKIGAERRSKICRDLLARDNWDLFLTVFSEPHSAGHYLWHLNQKDHPLHGKRYDTENLLLDVFKAVDKAIGEIVEAAPADASIVIFSAHGMQSNNLDVPSTFVLPELMYRWSFPGKVMFENRQSPQKDVPDLPLRRLQRKWYRDIWAQKEDGNAVARFLRGEVPTQIHRPFTRLAHTLGVKKKNSIFSPYDLEVSGDKFYWQPSSWYKPLWPEMKAFSLPSFSEGYIRINLKGREPSGLVEPADYDSVCEELIELLGNLRNPQNNQSVVERVIRTRKNPTDSDVGLPDADLVVIWSDAALTECIDSPEYGRFGSAPFQRSGSHTPNGFLMVQSPNLHSDSVMPSGRALDLAPTILDLMGAPLPDYLEGQSLVEKVASPAELAYSVV